MARTGTFHGESKKKAKPHKPKPDYRGTGEGYLDHAPGRRQEPLNRLTVNGVAIGKKAVRQEGKRNVASAKVVAKSSVRAARTIAKNMNAIAHGRTRESGPIKRPSGRTFVV